MMLFFLEYLKQQYKSDYKNSLQSGINAQEEALRYGGNAVKPKTSIAFNFLPPFYFCF